MPHRARNRLRSKKPIVLISITNKSLGCQGRLKWKVGFNFVSAKMFVSLYS